MVTSKFDSTFTSNWTGASGQQIGFAGAYPVTTPYGFNADPIHGQAVDPNAPSTAAQPGPSIDVPMGISANDDYVTGYMGEYGWDLDNLQFSPYNANPANSSHDQQISAATRDYNIDRAHSRDQYQIFPPPGHGEQYYGQQILTEDLHAWRTTGNKPSYAGERLPQARNDNSDDWPVPFDSTTVAPLRAVIVDQERIPMLGVRMTEDDRPLYHQLAIPARNASSGTTPFTPAYDSNVLIRGNIIATPEMPRTPEDPWLSVQSASDTNSMSYMDVMDGVM